MRQINRCSYRKRKQHLEMNKLSKKTCYLIGAIDRANDLGSTWRSEIQVILKERFGVNVYNPLEKPINIGVEDVESRERRRIFKKNGMFRDFADEIKLIRRVDLRMVDKSDFLICYIDIDVFMCGTFEECSLANRQKKPVIVFCKQGVNNIPDWLFGMLPYQLFFNNAEEVLAYLESIDNGTNTEYLNRWLFFDR